MIAAIVISGLLGFYVSTFGKVASSVVTQTQPSTVNLDVVPDYGGATYDAFVLAANMLNGVIPTPATNTTGPGANDNNITVTAGVPVKFVLTSLDNAINENFSAQVTTPFSVYNDTASGQAVNTYSAGQSISAMPVGHTFTIAQLGLNIPIPPTTVVTFSMTISKPGLLPIRLSSTLRSRNGAHGLHGRIRHRTILANVSVTCPNIPDVAV